MDRKQEADDLFLDRGAGDFLVSFWSGFSCAYVCMCCLLCIFSKFLLLFIFFYKLVFI